MNSAGKYWYQADALGSVYTLTTSTGLVQARGGYDVFGAPVAEYGQAVGQPFGFTGREHELDAGLVYARARYLSTVSGQWMRADPMGFVDGPNRYAFAIGNPTNFTDPMGLSINPLTRAIAGFASEQVFDAAAKYLNMVLEIDECDPDMQVVVSLVGSYVAWLVALGVVAMAVEGGGGGGGGGGGLKNLYKSAKDAPGYPRSFKAVPNGLKKVNVKNKELLDGLRKVEPGKWKKVYSNGYPTGSQLACTTSRALRGRCSMSRSSRSGACSERNR